MAQGLGHGEIGVVQPHVLAHEADAHAAARAVHPLHHLAPLGQIRLRRLETEAPADCAGQSRLLQPQRGLVEVRQGDVRYDAVLRDVAEIRHLAENAPVLNGLVAAQDDDVRRDAQALELLYRVLGGLRLVLARGAQVGHERDVDEKRVPPPGLAAYLANGLYEGLALDIAYGAADLGYEHVRSRARGQGADAALYLVRDVRYGLHRAAQVLAAALLLYDAGVDPARREVRQAVELLVYEALVVAEVEVGLRAVGGDEDLAVLIGAHGAGVHVYVGVQLLRRHLEAARFEEPAQARRRDALAQPGHHTARHEYVLCHCPRLPLIRKSL